jgi:heterodisulfide reductase subunit A-like polyferredoxin
LCLEGNFGDFTATIETADATLQKQIGAVVLAIGSERERPAALPLGVALGDFGRRLAKGEKFGRVCILMDLGQNTPLAEFRLGLESALKAARQGAKVYLVCKEVKVAEEGLEGMYRSAREEGVLFVKYEAPPSVAPLGEEISVQVVDCSPGSNSHLSSLRIAVDAVVAPDHLLPRKDNLDLSARLGTELDGQGYFQPANVRLHLGRTNRRGIYVIGDCRAPSTPTETIEQAEATAQEVAGLLGAGEVRVSWPVAVVDPEKCAFCLTCNRICPHKAAGMDLKEESAVIFPSDCYGCGVCVAECPAAAITIGKYADADLVEALKS